MCRLGCKVTKSHKGESKCRTQSTAFVDSPLVPVWCFRKVIADLRGANSFVVETSRHRLDTEDVTWRLLLERKRVCSTLEIDRDFSRGRGRVYGFVPLGEDALCDVDDGKIRIMLR